MVANCKRKTEDFKCNTTKKCLTSWKVWTLIKKFHNDSYDKV